MELTSITWSLAGGALIGLSASLLLLFNGRVAGISGMLGGLLTRQPGPALWRPLFLTGLLLGGAIAYGLLPGRFDASGAPGLPLLVIAGLLVGMGTQIGSGCTSGHGVCGISRLSIRSIAATLTFILTGGLTVFFMRAVGMLG